jgi:RNA polymerase sigma factor (sigma-70 family)
VSVSLSLDGPGDAELIAAVRGGDVEAYGELFARHVDAARRLARQLAGAADADDLVSDAFTKVLMVLQRGGGPDLAFRAYLLTAVRRLHVDKIRAGSRLRPVDDMEPFDPGLPFHDTAVEGFDNAAAARAFASLPERWQMVLWHTEVEQQKPADIAPLLGMSANSVSALAYRAREGLRQAFLSQHAVDPDDVDCAWTRDHLGAYVRGGLSRRDVSRVDEHLAACRACAAVYLELTEVNSGLAGILAPLLLGTAGTAYLSGGGAGSGTFSGGLGAAKAWAVSHASLTAVGGLLVTGAAVISVFGVTHLHSHNTADLGSPPPLASTPVASTLPSAGPTSHAGHQGSRTHNATTSRRGAILPAVVTSSQPTSPATTPSAGQSTPADNPPSTEPTSTPPSTEPTTAPPSTKPTTPPTTDPTTPSTTPITFDTTPPPAPGLHSTYVVGASGGTGRAILFSVDDTTSNAGTPQAACSIVGATVTFDHAGSCVIDAQEDTSAGSTASLPRAASADTTVVQQVVDVPQVALDLGITPALDAMGIVGSHVAVTVTGATADLVQVSAAPQDVCSVVDGVLYYLNPGTCQVQVAPSDTQDYTGVYGATVKVVAPQIADLSVSAAVVSGNQNTTRVSATVTGLPQGAQAQLTVAPEGNYALKPVDDGGLCQKTGPASYQCPIDSDHLTFDFEVNVHQGTNRVVDFEVEPVQPLTDSNPTNNTFRLQLDA